MSVAKNTVDVLTKVVAAVSVSTPEAVVAQGGITFPARLAVRTALFQISPGSTNIEKNATLYTTCLNQAIANESAR